MAITAATRTQLIGLSVAMLGQAPGTDRLNQWVADIDGDAMSVDDLANHIAESEAFQSEYPAFLTSMEFAKAFLGSVLPGLDEASMTEAVDIVSGMLDSGTSRGTLALAVVDFLHDVADKGMDHASYESFGMSAMLMANKIEVASHYTLNARMMDPSSDVLANVTADADSAAMAIDAIENPPVAPPSTDGDVYTLTGLRDNITGTAGDDTIIAEPTLNPVTGQPVAPIQAYDAIDGGDGMDTLEVYSSGTLSIRTDQVKNVEYAVLNAQTSINADMSEWEGLMSVDAARFDGDVTIRVAGAMVSLGEEARGANVEIEGAGGALEINAGKWTDIHVISDGHTESVMTTGGNSVTIDNDGDPSMTVTSAMVAGINGDTDADADGVQTKEEPAITVSSNAIEMVDLSGTYVTALIENKSSDAEDITLTLSGYGGQSVDTDGNRATPTAQQEGKICLAGSGAAENVSIVVNGSSRTHLASDAMTLAVSGTSGLNLRSVKDARGNAASKTLESVMVSGEAGLTLNADGNSALESVDASESSGRNSFSNLGSSVETVMGGSNRDSVSVKGELNADGIMVSLGDGDDTYTSSIGSNEDSRIDGGDGMDTLKLTSGDNATYEDADGEVHSIYTNFEVLDVGGSSSTFDVRQLGVQYVEVSKNTSGATLENMADGMGITVKAGATWRYAVINGEATWGQIGEKNTSTVSHELAARESGEARHSGKLAVSLVARGAHFDSTSEDAAVNGAVVSADGAPITGTVALDLTADGSIEVLEVDTSVSPGGALTARLDPDLQPAARHYVNTLNIGGTSTAIEDLQVTGNAKLTISTANANTLANLEVLNATANSSGVTFNAANPNGAETATALSQNLELLGGTGGDNLTGGAGADLIYGGAGGDSLSGGGGSTSTESDVGNFDTFDLTSVSDSQLRFTSSGAAYGFDRISGWGDGGNEKILLSESLFGSLGGVIKMANPTANANLGVVDPTEWLIDSRRADGNGGDTDPANVDSIKAFVDKYGDGFFETSIAAGAGFGNQTKHHSIALVNEFYEVIDTEAKDAVTGDDPSTEDVETNFEISPAVSEESTEYSRTWIFIDVDGDGDFNAANDMAIALVGDINDSDDSDQSVLTTTGIAVVQGNFVDEIPGA